MTVKNKIKSSFTTDYSTILNSFNNRDMMGDFHAKIGSDNTGLNPSNMGNE